LRQKSGRRSDDQKVVRAHRGSNTGPIDLQSIALPLSYTPKLADPVPIDDAWCIRSVLECAAYRNQAGWSLPVNRHWGLGFEVVLLRGGSQSRTPPPPPRAAAAGWGPVNRQEGPGQATTDFKGSHADDGRWRRAARAAHRTRQWRQYDTVASRILEAAFGIGEGL